MTSSSLKIPKTSGIYRLDFSSGYFYVGQSTSIARRWKEHRSSFKKGGMKRCQLKLFNVWTKYGEPTIKPLVVCEVEQLDVVEQFYLDRHWGDQKLCNTNPSATSTKGRPSHRKGLPMKEESRQLILGVKHGMAKLSEDQVREIRQRYAYRVRGRSSRALAKYYGVSYPVILHIVKNKSYTNVN